MARGGLIAIGIIIIVGIYFFTNIIYTPQQGAQLKIAKAACDSTLGAMSGALSSSIAKDCQQVRIFATIFEFAPLLYLLGGILFLVGLAVPSKNK